MSFTLRLSAAIFAIIAAAIIFGTFERPPMQVVQRGYRGVGMVENYNPRFMQALLADNKAPQPLGATVTSGPAAGTVYKNVKVLSNVPIGEFVRLMASMTVWVAPQQGCSYCHNPANMASDEKYTKVVARRMLQMVQHINGNWGAHVQAVGVTCYTCHRGQPVPAYVWYTQPTPPVAGGYAQSFAGKNHPSPIANNSSLPSDPLTPFLLGKEEIRVQSATPLLTGDRSSIKQTDWTYALMMHFSESLGVNCTFCHNSRAFENWAESTPQRVTAWYGIRMVRDLNNAYLGSLMGVFPPYRLGALGDVPKVNCATCHQGAYQPLFGASMIGAYPELAHPTQ